MIKFVVLGLWKQFLKVYVYFKPFCVWGINTICPPCKISPLDIPIIINNRNRLTMLKQLINSMESRGYKNIYIIDNNSSYPPLLEYYEKEYQYNIFRLKENMGHLALWKTDIIDKFRDNYFVYTDPDVVPIDECPADFMDKFLTVMKKKPLYEKVGFSLSINDLPDTFDKKNKVIEWESQFWKKKLSNDPCFYKAPIDTTFALYRPWMIPGGNLNSRHIRFGYPYIARHLPWYNNSKQLGDEEYYYITHSETASHWSTGRLK